MVQIVNTPSIIGIEHLKASEGHTLKLSVENGKIVVEPIPIQQEIKFSYSDYGSYSPYVLTPAPNGEPFHRYAIAVDRWTINDNATSN